MGKRIDELTENTSPALEDLLVMVDDPSSTHVTRKVTLTNVRTTLLADPVATNAQGDVYYYNGTAKAALTAGTKGKALTTGGASANPSWEGMTTSGDIEYHNGTTRTRLAKGTNGDVLVLSSGLPSWTASLSLDDDTGVVATNQGLTSVYTNLDVRGTPADGDTHKFFVGHFQIYVGTEDNDAGIADSSERVALFAGIQRDSSRLDPVWSFNTVMQIKTGADVYSAIGYELDVNNRHADMPDAASVTASLDGLHINSGGTKISYCGLLINQVGSANEWRRGIWIPDSAYLGIGIEVGSTSWWDHAAMVLEQAADTKYGLVVFRATDTTPSGQLIACSNTAQDTDLFIVSAEIPSGAGTNVSITVDNGAAVLRQIVVGAENSGGTGYRMLRVAN